jgi:hypothetical protein
MRYGERCSPAPRHELFVGPAVRVGCTWIGQVTARDVYGAAQRIRGNLRTRTPVMSDERANDALHAVRFERDCVFVGFTEQLARALGTPVLEGSPAGGEHCRTSRPVRH